jgi:hypothetical protein
MVFLLNFRAGGIGGFHTDDGTTEFSDYIEHWNMKGTGHQRPKPDYQNGNTY